ncbi:MAG: histidine phosphatase family protein [Promethearchaeota archaeon]|jgi:broad specificity phosphatase PhoE
MGKLILLNDIHTETDEAQLLVGDADLVASKEGNNQAEIIGAYFSEKVPNVDLIYSSDAVRLRKLVHKIRTNSKDQSLTTLTPRRLEGLRERSFGVLNGTPLSLDSDVFSHTRIKPEKGESVFECRVRVMKCIKQLVEICADTTVILLVSHPFICQIAFNAVLQKDHTLLTEFWHEKGSFAILVFEKGTYGIQWSFESGYNALADTSYTQDEIYRRLFGKERAFPS